MSARELRAEQLRCRAGGRLILDGVDLTVLAGQPLAVAGPSGSGKTTLLTVLSGLDQPASGGIFLDGQPLHALGATLRSRCAVVLQTYGLVPVLTAAENVAVPLQAQALPRALIRQRTEEALATVGLADHGRHLAYELSGGQQQRVAVARALAMQPDVLLADEPTAELDAESRARILRALLDHCGQDRIVIIASHDPEVAGACAGELRLRDGRVHAAHG